MKNDIYLVGGGGHCKSSLDVVQATGRFDIRGIVDLPENQGEIVCGIKVIATDDDLERLVSGKTAFLITLGFIHSPSLRIKLYETLHSFNAWMPKIVSPKAYVASQAQIDAGTIVMHGALVNSSAYIGKNCIVNSNALVEHDAIVGDHCHISTGAIVNGDCHLSEGVFVGSNAVLANGVTVAAGAIIGAGSVVHKNIKEAGVYAGNPFRKIR